jgi:hypothetical protein
LTIARRRPRRKHQEKIVHPVIMRQLAADHIAELHARAEDERLTRPARWARLARRAGRRGPSMRLRLSPRGTLSYDDPRLDAGQQPTTHEQPTVPPVPVMAARTRGVISGSREQIRISGM